jgi:prepilin-type processing-associated H-X9-DG protein
MPLNYDAVDNASDRRPAEWTVTNDPVHPKYGEFFQSGVIYYRSQLKLSRITDGTSKTYLVGEKYMDANTYDTSGLADDTFTYGDNQSAYTGNEWDNQRVAWQPGSPDSIEFHQPRQDTPGFDPFRSPAFGSAHVGGYNTSFCDGSVRTISYSIDHLVHRWLANRLDGQTVNDDAI